MGNAERDSDQGYGGPTVAGRSRLPSAEWIWVANGTDPTFSPPTVSPASSVVSDSGTGTSFADRVIESFRIEALELDGYDPLLDELLEDHDEGTTGQLPPLEIGPPDLTITEIEISVLGPVEVHGWAARPERAIVTELACYLALHRDRPVTGEALRAALRPDPSNEQSAKTLRTYLSLLRKALGPEALPARPSGGYQLAPSVRTDWDRFRDLTGEPGTDEALQALALIRGRPFEGVAAGTYTWVFSEFLVSDMEAAIASVTIRTATALSAVGDLERAVTALRQGLTAVGGDYALWELYLSVAADLGAAALARAREEARASLGDDAPIG
jgi:hypothetical protein